MPSVLHVVGVHGDGVDDGLVFGVVLADVDLLALLGGAARIHQETLTGHRKPMGGPKWME